MERHTTLVLALTFLGLALGSCNLPAAVRPSPTAAPSEQTPTQPAEATSMPTDTPVPTATPSPTSTPGRPPGEVLYVTDFGNLSGWTSFPWWKADVFDVAGADFSADIFTYVAEVRNGRYHFEVPKRYTQVAAIYQTDLDSPDVALISDTELTLKRPWTFISLICRYTEEEGWYEFTIHADGFWGIMKVSYLDGTLYQTEDLVREATDAIDASDHGAPNRLEATCKGEQLSFTVNGVRLGAVEDASFAEGLIGVGVAAGEQGNSHVDFDNLRVEVPR